MNSITLFFNSIIEIGYIKNKHEHQEKKLIILFNLGCIFCYIIGAAQLIRELILDVSNINIIILNTVIIFGIFINHIIHWKQHFKIARLLFIYFIILTMFIASNFLVKGKLLELFYFLIPGTSILFFDNKYINYTTLIVCILCFTIPDSYFNIYDSIDLFSPIVVYVFVSFFIMAIYFKKLNKKNEQLLAIERDKVLSDKITLEKQEEKLRELDTFKTHLFVNLSHEIRTPLTLIKGYTKQIHSEELAQKSKEKLSIVNNQIIQIENIVDSILDLSKLDENKLILNKQNVSIDSLAKKHFAQFKIIFNEKNIDFNLINDTKNLVLNIDNNLFSKALNNLLNNAFKFTVNHGCVTLKIYQKKDLFIEVVDTGIGIPEKDYDTIFQRFYQSKNEITESQGSGIGLFFTKSILEAHEFSISVKSIPNTATTFTIIIPEKHIITEENIETNLLLEEISKEDNPKNISLLNTNESILIVDDNKELRNYIKIVLKSYKIFEAENGLKALEIIKKNNIDLILTDYMMPEMDGKKLVLELKKLQVKIPVIMITARVDDFAKINMLRIGIDSYIIKPFLEEELLLTIKNSLKTYKNIAKNQEELTSTEKKELNEIEQIFDEKITTFIENNISDFNFGVEDVAVFFKISTRTLNRRVKSILGQTTKELIMQAKIEKARTLQLQNTEMTKKEIANAVGINSPNYLFRMLAEKYGNHYKT